MPLFVKRNDTKEIIRVRKYIINDQEESIWSNEWYGRHIIGQDCEWLSNFRNPNSDCFTRNREDCWKVLGRCVICEHSKNTINF